MKAPPRQNTFRVSHQRRILRNKRGLPLCHTPRIPDLHLPFLHENASMTSDYPTHSAICRHQCRATLQSYLSCLHICRLSCAVQALPPCTVRTTTPRNRRHPSCHGSIRRQDQSPLHPPKPCVGRRNGCLLQTSHNAAYQLRTCCNAVCRHCTQTCQQHIPVLPLYSNKAVQVFFSCNTSEMAYSGCAFMKESFIRSTSRLCSATTAIRLSVSR